MRWSSWAILGALSAATAVQAAAPGFAPDVRAGRERPPERAESATPPSQPQTDTVGTWYLIGSGYAELQSADNAQAAFQVQIQRVNQNLDQLTIGLSRGSADNVLSSQKDVARFVLSPETSPWSAFVNYDKWSFARTSFDWGLYVSGSVGAADWKVDDAKGIAQRSALVFAQSAGLSLKYLREVGQNVLAIQAHVGFTNRVIMGDVYADHAFIQRALSIGQNDFCGLDSGFWLQLNTVTVGVSFPILAGHVPGLTNGQFLPTLVVGGRVDLTSVGAHAG